MDQRMVAAVLPVLVAITFWGYCLVDFSRTDERDMQVYSRQAWVLWLSFGSLLGALLWYFQGRPDGPRRQRRWANDHRTPFVTGPAV